MTSKPKVFTAMPYSGTVQVGALLAGCHLASRDPEVSVFHCLGGPPGVHCENFNKLWSEALNTRAEKGWTHFAMIHSDVEPEPGWLDVLLEEMRRVGADVLAVVLAVKDNRGLTSTALQDRTTLYTHRLTLKELSLMPQTFDAKATGEPDSDLLIASGLWVCDFTKPWVENVWFEMRDRIIRTPDGKFSAANWSEDWNFSRQCRELGVKVFATTKVQARHHGAADYDNFRARGTWAHDEDASYGGWLRCLKGLSALEEGKEE